MVREDRWRQGRSVGEFEALGVVLVPATIDLTDRAEANVQKEIIGSAIAVTPEPRR